MAYITKRGSSYGVRYTYQDEQGKNCNKWESFSTKEEATNRKKQIEHELANGTFLIPSTITVKKFLMEWLPKQCNKHKWAPCTYQSKALFRWTALKNRFRSVPSGMRTRCGPHHNAGAQKD